MPSAKDIVLKPIDATTARAVVRKNHYSGKVVNNSQLHIGVYLDGQLEGAMQFGPSLDKRRIMPLVEGTGWNEFIELNRMAFSDRLPRNSESRALSVAMRLLRQYASHIKWVVSFADATQSGDGAIYRAVGFVLTGIKENTQIWSAPDGVCQSRQGVTDTRRPARSRELHKIFAGSFTRLGRNGASRQRRIITRVSKTKGVDIQESGAASMKPFIEAGYKPLQGYQLRYIYFLDTSWRDRLTVPVIPYSRIDEMGAGMYRGEHVTVAERNAPEAEESRHAASSGDEGGSSPTLAL